MSKPASQPKPGNLRDKKRSEGRFRERELARAALASGAERVDVDPASGKFSVILPGKAGAAGNDLDTWMAQRDKDAHQS
jgi:hypothetical protein